jgi:hypothetical protein
MYRAFVTEKYTSNGEKKVRHHRVGVGFDAEKGGVDVIIAPGVSVSGKLHVRPERERAGGAETMDDTGDDFLE